LIGERSARLWLWPLAQLLGRVVAVCILVLTFVPAAWPTGYLLAMSDRGASLDRLTMLDFPLVAFFTVALWGTAALFAVTVVGAVVREWRLVRYFALVFVLFAVAGFRVIGLWTFAGWPYVTDEAVA